MSKCLKYLVIVILLLTTKAYVYGESLTCEEYIEQNNIENAECDERGNLINFGSISSKTDSSSFSESMSKSILSDNTEIQGKEKIQFYYKYLWKINFVNSYEDTDNSWLSVDSIEDTTVVIITLLINFVGLISFILSYLIMFLTYIYTNSIIATVINSGVEFVGELLEFDSTTGKWLVIGFAFGLFALMYTTLDELRKKTLTLKGMLKKIVVTFLTINMIALSYNIIRPMLLEFNITIRDAVVSTIADDSDEYEITLKHRTFNVIKLNGYIQEFFGVQDFDELVAVSGSDEEARARLDGVIRGNSKVVEKEIEEYKNGNLIVTPMDALEHLFINVLYIIHMILAVIILGIPLLLLIIVDVIQVLAYGFIWIAVIRMLFTSGDQSKIIDFIINRLVFTAVYIAISVIGIIIIIMLENIYSMLFSLNIGYVLLIDIFIVFLLYLLYSNRESILDFVRTFVKEAYDRGKKIITGEYSVNDLKSDIGSMTSKAKDAIFKSDESKVELDNTSVENSANNTSAENSSNVVKSDSSLAEDKVFSDDFLEEETNEETAVVNLENSLEETNKEEMTGVNLDGSNDAQANESDSNNSVEFNENLQQDFIVEKDDGQVAMDKVLIKDDNVVKVDEQLAELELNSEYNNIDRETLETDSYKIDGDDNLAEENYEEFDKPTEEVSVSEDTETDD